MILLLPPSTRHFEIGKSINKRGDDWYDTYCGSIFSDRSEARAQRNSHLISLDKICKSCLEKVGRDITFDLINYKLGVK